MDPAAPSAAAQNRARDDAIETAMTTQAPDTQWFIAREGKQYGPLSDQEMQKLVELGHLKPADLVWRPGLTDWRPAASILPQPQSAAPPPPAPMAQPQAQPAPQPQAQQRTAVAQPGPQQSPYPNAQPQPQSYQQAPAQRVDPATAGRMQQPSTGGHGPQPGAGMPSMGGRMPQMQQPAPQPHPYAQPAQVPQQSPYANAPMPQLGAPAALPTPAQPGRQMQAPADATARRATGPAAARQPDIGKEPSSAPTPGRKRTIAAGLIVLVVAAGAGLLLSKKGTMPNIAAVAPGGSERVAPLGNLTSDTDTLDANFQRTQLWIVVKKEFPDWYGERLKEVAKLTSENKPEDVVAKHLTEALVALRRQNAEKALAASTPKLKDVASAFLSNLRALSAKSTDACYNFISQGETSPAIIEMMRSPDQAKPVQAQVAAIFEAIAEGRKSPVTHSTPIKSDYDALADQLTKLGWTQADLQLFADSKSLARAKPEKVCRMVQDWFVAHIGIPDPAVQERLLVETLRPVVAG